ncbi:cupredoxin domain-containing protein [Streptomyces sp. NBC_01217]|uniref:cupredoxin domain-containing protein n=1 Tax=Streptomyces sp. NBC_01217 TaxID=2903779 RepID=UPI002E11D046|nr:cupredoxin domain-containing protein [Streptomyces sp. NBC_01217]
MGNRSRAAVAVIAVGVFAAAVGGCTDGGGGGSSSSVGVTPPAASPASPSPSSPPVGRARVTIKDFAFGPARLTVAPGTLITVVNEDSATHTVTATSGKAFDTGDVASGRTVTFTAPDKAGTYPYICTIHPYMKGSLTVR